MNRSMPRPRRRETIIAGLLLLPAALGLVVTASAHAQAATGIAAVYSPTTATLTVTGDDSANTITISRTAAGALRVNGGAVPIQGGSPTVANTTLLEVDGRGAGDRIVLNEASGALPAGRLSGGDGADTVEVSGGANNDMFNVFANGTMVRVDRQPGAAGLDIVAAEQLILKGNGGDDSMTATGNLAALVQITMDGGPGNDTLLGSNGADLLLGGPGNDFVDGQQGADTALLGDGADTFQWDPGDGNDIVEGQAGTDTLTFNGSAIGETFDLTANGPRVRFTRNIAAIVMDLDGIETLALNAFGGPDIVTVNDLAGTALSRVNVNLATTGGTAGDSQADVVFVNGTAGDDRFVLGGSATAGVTVARLGKTVAVTGGEVALDRLTVNGLGGADVFDGSNAPGGRIDVVVDGGDDIDSAEMNGGSGDDTFTVTANGALVRVDRPGVTPVAFDAIAEQLILKGNGGNDTMSAVGNLAALIRITMDGGPGDDTLLGSNGADLLLGGSGDDFVDGQQGADTAHLGDGADTFQWDPGDGNDVVEGQAGVDTLIFNGSNIGETFDLSANGTRVRFTRNIAAIVLDLDGIETVALNAVGGPDIVTVTDLTGTALSRVNVNLAATGGTAGDGQPDSVTVNGTAGDDQITVSGTATTGVTVSGLAATVVITGSEAALDRLTIAALAGADIVNASGLPAGLIALTMYGDDGNDTLTGSDGDDGLSGGDGDDTLRGGPGADRLDGGAGTNVIIQE